MGGQRSVLETSASCLEMFICELCDYMVICYRQEAHKARLTTVIPQVNSNSCMFNAVDVGRLPRSPLSTAFLAMAFSEKRVSLGPRISVGSFVATWEELK